jgi:hypothetical protein
MATLAELFRDLIQHLYVQHPAQPPTDALAERVSTLEGQLGDFSARFGHVEEVAAEVDGLRTELANFDAVVANAPAAVAAAAAVTPTQPVAEPAVAETPAA